MEVLLRKYGGSSLATLEQLREVAEVTARRHRAGRRLVLVVSARGAATDDLLRFAGQVSGDLCAAEGREVDQLIATGECASAAAMALALRKLGIGAVSLTGAQAGIEVVGPHGAGKITRIRPDRLLDLLDHGMLPVVGGFHGENPCGDTVTLGRGGSDTTAVALCAALRSSTCEIYTDVHGVCTADPRIVSTARVLPVIDVGVMAEMAFAGAKVVHSRAVELAALRGITLRVNGSPARTEGTVIVERNAVLEGAGAVVAVADDPDVALVRISCGTGTSRFAADVFAALADLSKPVDQVARSEDGRDGCRIGLTVGRCDLADVRAVLEPVAARHGGVVHVRDDVAKVSLVGVGLLNRPEHPALLTGALDRADVPVGWMSTSQARISVLVPRELQVRAVDVLHRAFALDTVHRGG